MSTPFDDLTPFFDPGEAQAATWTPAVGSPVAGHVWFGRPDAAVLDDLHASDPSITYRVSQWPTVRDGDQVLIGTTNYRVRGAPLRIDDGLLARAFLKG